MTSIIALFVYILSTHLWAKEPAHYVDPMIGTGGRMWSKAMLSPAVTTPFGMVKVGPETRMSWWIPEAIHKAPFFTAGYSDNHPRVYGFGHARLSGTGARVGSFIRVLPLKSEKKLKKKNLSVRLDKSSEKARVGFYQVELPSEKVRVSLTATERCAYHRYEFKKNSSAHLLLDPTSTLLGGSKNSEIYFKQLDPAHFELAMTQNASFAGRYGGLRAYAYVEVEPAPRKVKPFNNEKIHLDFGNTSLVNFKLCLSYVSNQNAQENFVHEIATQSFEAIQKSTVDKWNHRLGKIELEADKDIKKMFYTALYHTHQMPTLMTDVNRQYLAFNHQIKEAHDFTYYSDLSLWDTFRTTHPLYTIIAPDIQLDSVKSLIEMAKFQGELPRWPQGGGDAKSMFGTPANFLIAETYLKNIGEFDVRTAFDLMIKAAKNPKDKPLRNPVCLIYQYCPNDLVEESVAKTLEYSWTDAVTATLAEALGENELAKEFQAYAQNYRQVWDSKTQYFRGKNSDGTWASLKKNVLTYFDLGKKQSRPYVEGSPRHWRFSVPHDPQGLIELFQGKSNFTRELHRFMSGASERRAALIFSPYYWHGNQHDIHAAYLFNHSHPEYTQYWVRWILETRYAPTSDAYDGNDDGGTLSAWYVLSGLGLYPKAGTDKYWLGSPVIKKAKVQLKNKTLTIIAHKWSTKNYFIDKVMLNSQRLCSPEISHHELEGELEFFMRETPLVGGGYDCKNSVESTKVVPWTGFR
ncbi:MAG: GH92 family glycosyl hydrolase [Bacteriovoracaceae bacterium]|nr:GH92 family glycosyl hydrolase [Bacteriovoracaceae bacterium]